MPIDLHDSYKYDIILLAIPLQNTNQISQKIIRRFLSKFSLKPSLNINDKNCSLSIYVNSHGLKTAKIIKGDTTHHHVV